MKRIFYYFFSLIIIFLFSFISVEAENDKTKTPPDMSTTYVDGEECTFARKDELRAAAANVVISYIPAETTEKIIKENGEEALLYNYYLDIKIYNVNTKLVIVAKDKATGTERRLDYHDLGADGTITIRVPSSTEQVRNWEFKIYSYLYSCFTDPIRTMKLTLPMYNINSDLNICDDIPDYYLCRQYVTSATDSEKFYKYVNAYKEKLDEREQSDNNISTGGINNVVSKIKDYKYLIVIILIIIGIITTVIIVLKRKKSDV